jgi:hypothetical protein
MAAFNSAEVRTSEKMSDLVMEYVSQFIARDFLENYEKAAEEGREDYTTYLPKEFDEKIYRKITRLIRKNTGQNRRIMGLVVGLFALFICSCCVAFTVMVLLNEGLRDEIFGMFIF